MCRLLGRCHPVDPVTSVVGDVPDALSEQVCHASIKMGRYDCGPGYVCLKGDQEPELVGEAHAACSCRTISVRLSLHNHPAVSMLLGAALNVAFLQLNTHLVQCIFLQLLIQPHRLQHPAAPTS